MTPEKFLKIQQIFDLVQEAQINQREEVLTQACQGDVFLQREVEKLLLADESAGGFLSNPISPLIKNSLTKESTVPKPINNVTLEKEFKGTERFQVKKCLGAGSFGIVYEVYDNEWNTCVALKWLKTKNAKALLNFKREFYSLITINHLNLVKLYEFFGNNEDCFFTMELIDGADFRSSTSERKLPNLLNIYLQLAEAIKVLHHAKKLHRDIKPSNILIKNKNHVVLLDFGLVADLFSVGIPHSFEAVGTPVYMSPEQMKGHPLTESSDWYSFGVMLFESITGKLPFSGNIFKILKEKETLSFPSLKDLVEDIPSKLNELCEKLLHCDITLRPSGEEIIGLLTSMCLQTNDQLSLTKNFARHSIPFFLTGRESEFAELKKGLEKVYQKDCAIVYVYGYAGTGKTSLVNFFLKELRGGISQVLVLTNTCYDQVFMPYKTLDGLIDKLVQYLKSFQQQDILSLIPSNTSALLQLFPVFGQLKNIKENQQPDKHISDVVKLRKAGIKALQELLVNLSKIITLVIFIDDIQWGDADSIKVFEEMFNSVNHLPFLLILSYRSENASSILVKLFRSLSSLTNVKTYSVELSELNLAQATDIATNLLNNEPNITEDRIISIVEESEGNLLLLTELIGHEIKNLKQGQIKKHRAISLKDIIQSNLEELPVSTRSFLEVIFAANCPMERNFVKKLLNHFLCEPNTINLLGMHRLISITSSEADYQIVPYHHSVRQVVMDSLSLDYLKSVHLKLATLLEKEQELNLEMLSTHFYKAENFAKALMYADKAADKAVELLAFDRAVQLYQFSLDVVKGSSHSIGNSYTTAFDIENLQIKLAKALSNGGHYFEAGMIYLETAKKNDLKKAVPFYISASEHLLGAGYYREGTDTLHLVCKKLNMAWPKTTFTTLLRLIFYRLLLNWRGFNFDTQNKDEVSQETLPKLDICWAATSMILTGDIRGIYFQSVHLYQALKANFPHHISLAFSLEAGLLSCQGKASIEKAKQFSEKAHFLAKEEANSYLLGWVKHANAYMCWHLGYWADSITNWDEAEKFFREYYKNAHHEIHIGQLLSLWALFFLGETKKLCEETPKILYSFKQRKDLLNEISVYCVANPIIHLVDDQPNKAVQEIDKALQEWQGISFSNIHWASFFNKVLLDLYCGDAMQAWLRVKNTWSKIKNSGLLSRVELARAKAYFLRGSTVLAAIVKGSITRSLLWEVKNSIKVLEKVDLPYAIAWANILKIGVVAFKKDQSLLIEALEFAEISCQKADMKLFLFAVRRQRGQLIKGETGKQLVDEADTYMKDQSIKDPSKITNMLVVDLSRILMQ